MIDFLKGRGITMLATSLTPGDGSPHISEVGVSSLIDTWVVLRQTDAGGERTRTLHILKSRGMEHSNQIRELIMSRKGLDLSDVCTGPAGVLTGRARVAQEARERSEQDKLLAKIEGRARSWGLDVTCSKPGSPC